MTGNDATIIPVLERTDPQPFNAALPPRGGSEPSALFSAPDPRNEQSHFLRVSIRAWIAILVSITVCAMFVWGIEVPASLLTIWGVIITFYFANKPPTQSPPN